jgi:hypothetical protein
MVGFDNPWRPTTIDGIMTVPPLDNDGPAAPAGTPGMFITVNDDAIGGGADQLWLYELDVDWSNTAASTFVRTQQLNVAPFDANFGTTWENITQPAVTRKLCAITQVIMNVPQYRNFGTYQTIVCCHTVDVDATNHAGVRWYELRKTDGAWSIRQQGTYAPDAHSRWMGSVMLNASGKIGMGYSVSSSTVYPSIRYTGQSSAAYASASGVMDVPEEVIHNGANSQTTYNRWGDYSLMSVDPVDNETFWFTTEYIGSGESRNTKIASFKIGNAPIATTLPATSVTTTSATLSGSVNPNSLATTCYFEWGTSTAYGNVTTTTSVGSGTSAVAVNAPIPGLTAGTTYHFRVVATNSDGTTNGADLTFTPGGAVVTTATVTNIALYSATGGGEVLSDGGLPVTARGICWSTSANPTTADSHTTDGSGLGVFSSSVTGLSSNTNYHVRAYATNTSGTYYGADVQFTTLCGIYTLPFTESFPGTTIPNCWSQVDNQGNGQIWQFGTVSNSPAPALTGNYAYLNSDAYGSGNSQNADLLTPTLDLTAFTNVTLSFKHYFRQYSGSSGKLSYSVDNGTTWTLIQTWSTTTTNPATFNQVIAGVSGYSQVKFKWNYTGSWGYYWAVDDISITGTGGGPYLSVTPSNQNVPETAGSTSFSVSSSVSWTASSNQGWCTVTPSGTGNGTITANYTANPGGARVATVTVTGSGVPSVNVTVSQSPFSPTLTVTPANRDVDAPAGTTTFTVTSNSAWTAVSNSAWCTVTPSGTGNGTITANYAENMVVDPRQAAITVTVAGLPAVTVTVSQSGATPYLSVTPPNQNIGNSNGSADFTVSSNTTWSSSSNVAWCTVTASGSGNGVITANCSENTELSPRTATITVTGNAVAAVTVTVTQSGAPPTLIVTPPNRDVSAPAGATTFNVSSNSPWTATSNTSWCNVTPSGTGNGTITATYEENTDLTSRQANLTVTVAGLPPVNVTVTQSGAMPTLSITPLNRDVTAPAGSTTFTVTSNSAWTTSSDAAWCTPASSGSGNGTLSVDYAENTTVIPRVASITVTIQGISPVVVSVTQEGAAPYLQVTPPSQTVPVTQGSTTFNVLSNADWTTSSDAPWCIVTPAGNGNGVITANFTENTTMVLRTAYISVTVNTLPAQVVQVIQLPSFQSLDTEPGSSITFFPNPTTGVFVISSSTAAGLDMDVSILDVHGKLMQNRECRGESGYTFDVSGYARGNYYLKVTSSQKTVVWKLVLQ